MPEKLFFSFYAMPGVKQLGLSERLNLYRKISKSQKLGSKFILLILLCFGAGLFIAGALVDVGVTGALVGYLFLFVAFIVWIIGYVFIMSWYVYPELMRLTSVSEVE